MDLAIELLTILGRILTVFPLLLIIVLWMGKRCIGELPVFDFLVIIIMASVVGADIADPNIEHIHTAFAVIVIGIVQMFFSKLAISNRKFGRMVTFEPTIVIHKGVFLNRNLKQIRYSIDNILNMLRENNIFDIQDVDVAIVEANGKLTVHKKGSKANVTIEDMGMSKISPGISYPVILEGHIYVNVLKKMNVTEEWLKQQIKDHGITEVKHIFFASINENHELYFSLKTDKDSNDFVPLILH